MTQLSPRAPHQEAPAARPAALRVVSVPAGHPYVARVTDAPGLDVLPDPPPSGAEPGRWWPPVALDPGWVRDHAADADLLHVHFGTESFAPEHLARTLDAARAAGWPVVVTVHDLEHPQLRDQAPYAAQLDVLVPGADAVLTLTPGAAAEVRARWGREALVVPHPRLLGDTALVAALGDPGAETSPAPAPVRVGVHLKDLRPNVDAVGTTRELIGAVAELRTTGTAARAEVRLHHQVRDPGAGEQVRALCAAAPDLVDLVEHDRLDDTGLAAALGRLDACVLPYAHGTHSGWLELCWDLGVPVAAPAVGYYAEQHPDRTVATFRPPAVGGPGAPALADALRTLLEAPEAARPGTSARADRVRERAEHRRTADADTARLHAALYRRLVAGRAR